MKRRQTSEPPKRDWERSQVTVRLTAARKELLASLVRRENRHGTPGDAIDLAIEIAAGEPGSDAALLRMDELEALSREMDQRRAREVAALRSDMDRLLVAISKLNALIARACEEER